MRHAVAVGMYTPESQCHGHGWLDHLPDAGHAQITAQPGPAAKNVAQQATFYPVSDLPSV